jgi:hypothetical protein
MHDFGGVVWIVIVLIGVISSINNNAKKARKAAKKQRNVVVTMAPPPVSTPPSAPVVHLPKPPTPMGHVMMPPVIAPEAPVAVPAPPRLEPLPVLPHTQASPIGTPIIRGMFQGPTTLVRAIVAAEVLGPPKSVQEPSIWSPRHSEPSI